MVVNTASGAYGRSSGCILQFDWNSRGAAWSWARQRQCRNVSRWDAESPNLIFGKLSCDPLGVSRTQIFKVKRSAVPANPERPVSAAADVRSPGPSDCTQSMAITRTAPRSYIQPSCAKSRQTGGPSARTRRTFATSDGASSRSAPGTPPTFPAPLASPQSTCACRRSLRHPTTCD